MMNKLWMGILSAVAAVSVAGCNATYMPSADPHMSDLTSSQAQELSKRKIHVPCAIEVHCDDDLTGQRDSAFFTDTHHYPLRAILANSFRNAAYQVFDPSKGEVIDSFTIYVTVQESNLDIAWGKANYQLQLIVRFDEPGEKKILASSVTKKVQVPLKDPNKVPDAVYMACRDAAFEAMQKILASPKLWRTIKRFEDK